LLRIVQQRPLERDRQRDARAQEVEECPAGKASRDTLEGQRVQPQLRGIKFQVFTCVARLDVIGLVIHQNQFAALFKPQIDLPAQEDILDGHHEIKFAFDSQSSRGTPAEVARLECVHEFARLGRGPFDSLAGKQCVHVETELAGIDLVLRLIFFRDMQVPR